QVTALQQALILQPDSADLHQSLKELYVRLGYRDLALDHLVEEIKWTQARGRQGIETMEEFGKRLESRDKESEEVESHVQRVPNDYELRAATEPLGVKAQQALQAGLAKRALEVLRQADFAQMTGQESGTYVQLLLTTGQLEELLQGFGPQLKTFLGPEYDWYRGLLSASAGDYTKAGTRLGEV